ncbi:hypothetical protein AS361_01815 [Myroides marinus]|uniref:hypothetical protein n=1 Tax=Myroides marinus TaxID=703342 RepID=UPI000741C6B4|nr:hypothetical protein [Myroides marinus]KUF39342.1 hypothetical protein AS361_01815 [Myroides marinus]
MRKYIVYICSIAAFFLSNIVALAQFPYQNTLTKEDEFVQFNTSEKVVFDKDGATLTPSTSSKGMTRGFYLNDLAFTVDRGFIIEFDYLMTGGPSSLNFADGLALVLFNGSVAAPKMGADGSGLGYSYKTPTFSGLTEGFLAVGIDLWGSFKFRRSESGEYRNGIRNGSTNSTLIADSDRLGKEGESRNHITIRGQGNGGKGYPVLITQSTTNFESRTMLNFSTGLYDKKPEAPQSTSFGFKLRENSGYYENDIDASFGHSSYRRISIFMLPGTKDGKKGFYMIVDMIHGLKTDRIIKDFFLPDNETIRYLEASSSSESSNVFSTLDLKAPATFKLGFVGSIGGYSQRQIVRNLSLYMPFSPSVENVYLTDVCKDTPTEIDVLANSVGFNNNIYTGGGDLHAYGDKKHLDPYSFQFRTIIGGLYEDTAQPYTAVTPYGTYEYNPVTTKIIFVPNKGATMPVSDQVYFTIRNKEKQLANDINLGNEQFRSNTGTVRLTFGKNCNDVLMVNGNSI